MAAALEYGQLAADEAFAMLGELYPDPMSALGLLEDIGANPAKVMAFAPGVSAERYWRSVCRDLSHGMFESGLDELFGQAARQFPGHPRLQALVAGGFGDGAGTDERDEIRLLCLLASPTDEARLRLEEEHREILEAVERAPLPIVLVVHPATRISDIVRVLVNAKPTIVHFSGHGAPDGGLIFERDSGVSGPVSVEALANMFEHLDGLECVVMNSCYSGRYAEPLLRAASAVIGSSSPIEDPCAITFAKALYTALGAGRPLAASFGIARAQMEIEGCPTADLRFVTRDA